MTKSVTDGIGRMDSSTISESADRQPCSWRHVPGYLCAEDADALLGWLLSHVPWRRERLRMFGRSVVVPRLVGWFGDEGASYRYSGVDHPAAGWPEPLEPLLAAVRRDVCPSVNFVLLNRYRNGYDHMGWHRDDEPELVGPVISLSVGASRRFRIESRPGNTHAVDLGHGSLLVHPRHWRHCVTRSRRVVGERVNLSFRTVGCR